MSAMLMVPVRVPVVVGVKVTLILHAPPAATEDPQVLVWPKLVLAVMDVMLNAALPVFVRVMTWAGLVVPTT